MTNALGTGSPADASAVSPDAFPPMSVEPYRVLSGSSIHAIMGSTGDSIIEPPVYLHVTRGLMPSAGFGYETRDEIGNRHRAKVFTTAKTHRHRTGFDLFVTDDKHVRHFAKLSVTDLRVHAF